jgi:HK97 family phage major capsid protein
MLSKLKDGDGRYLWAESVTMDEPDRLLGIPAYSSEYAPNTFTTGQYVGILGDFGSGYWIADQQGLEVRRAEERYIETNQTGIFVRMSGDGMPVLEEAFVRVKLA